MKLINYAGYNGYIGDSEFSELTDLLEKEADVIDEQEEAGLAVDYIITIYREKVKGTEYRLMYQVRNIETPEEIDLVCEFDLAG